MEEDLAIQDFYEEQAAQCYGCGRLNEHGLQLKTRWDGDETVTIYTPRSYHTAVPGYVYGGLLASLVDCHSTGSAALAAARAQHVDLEKDGAPRYVTASLQVDYLKPTPLGVPLEVRGHITEIKGRKVVVDSTLSASGVICVKGHVVAVQAPENLFSK